MIKTTKEIVEDGFFCLICHKLSITRKTACSHEHDEVGEVFSIKNVRNEARAGNPRYRGTIFS